MLFDQIIKGFHLISGNAEGLGYGVIVLHGAVVSLVVDQVNHL
jgi:hypothetical protein